MALAEKIDCFSLPLRQQLEANLSGDMANYQGAAPYSPIGGMASYVGDAENDALRYFADSQRIRTTDWPIVLFGPSGTGKTSLALTLAADVWDASRASKWPSDSQKGTREIRLPEKPIIATGADFARRFRGAINTDSVADLRAKIERCSVLLIDGIESLSTHSAAQLELTHMLDRRIHKGLPVVVTSSRPPHECEDLLPPLSSRLSSGLCLEVRPPGPSARREIVNKLCEIYRLELTQEAIDWMVRRFDVTVPKLNHLFAQLKTSVESSGETHAQRIGCDYLMSQLSRLGNDQSRLSVAILEQVAAAFQLKRKDLEGSSRKQTVVLARSIGVYLMRKLLQMSYARIGDLFGGRDHSTVMHSFRKIQKMVSGGSSENATGRKSASIKKTVLQLEQKLTDQFTGHMQFD